MPIDSFFDRRVVYAPLTDGPDLISTERVGLVNVALAAKSDDRNLRAAPESNIDNRSANPAAYIHLRSARFVPAFHEPATEGR